MGTLVRNFGTECDTRVNYDRYRFHQIFAIYAGLILGKSGSRSIIGNVTSKMTMRERILYGVPLSIVVAAMATIMPKRYRALIADLLIRATGSHQGYSLHKIDGNYKTILDVFEQVSPSVSGAE
jgi:hypothetical protein